MALQVGGADEIGLQLPKAFDFPTEIVAVDERRSITPRAIGCSTIPSKASVSSSGEYSRRG